MIELNTNEKADITGGGYTCKCNNDVSFSVEALDKKSAYIICTSYCNGRGGVKSLS